MKDYAFFHARAQAWKGLARKFRRAYKLATDPKLLSLHLDEGGPLTMGIKADGVGMIMAHSFWELLSEHPEAKNFIEMVFERHGEVMTVTVQRQYGKTPARMKADVEAERDKMRPFVEWMADQPCIGNGSGQLCRVNSPHDIEWCCNACRAHLIRYGE